MKYFLLLFFPVFIKAQDYKTFPTDSASWTIKKFILLGSSFNQRYTYMYKLDGDTTLGNQSYSKLYKSGFYHLTTPGSSFDTTIFYNYDYMGGIRELNKKVYFRSMTSEYILFDYTLEVGDTFICSLPYFNPIEIGDSTSVWTLYSIDSIELQQQFYKRFNFHNNGGYEKKIIERIGLVGDFLDNWDTYYTSETLCFSDYQGLVFPQDSLSCVNYLELNDEYETEKFAQIYYNNNLIYVKPNTNQTYNFIIYNLQGQELFRKENNTGPNSFESSISGNFLLINLQMSDGSEFRTPLFIPFW